MLSPQDGPILIQAVTIRVRGHSEHNDASYVPRELLAEWQEKDPIAREIEEAILFAEQSFWPEPEDALTDVYAD